MCSARPARAVSPSTRPTRPCGSPTCPPASWSGARRNARSCRTARRRCVICARVCCNGPGRRRPRRRRPLASRRWGPVSAPRRSEPTTSPRTGSPITASSSRSTGCRTCWRGIWTRSSRRYRTPSARSSWPARRNVRPSQVLLRAADYLRRHDVESPKETAEVLLMYVLRIDRAGLYARETGLDAREARMFGRAICQRCAGTPVQHLTGEQTFRRITLEVVPGVFVPRPETEVLVEHALWTLGDREDPLVVDPGTGTGAIALAIKDERPDATVYGTDLSAEAVDLARANAARLGLMVTFLEGDLLEPLPADLRGWVDVIVSNPPYVPPEEIDDLPSEVRADPRLALAGGTEGHRRLAEQAPRWLRSGGALAVEHDACQGKRVAALPARRFTRIHVGRDLAGRDRVVLARTP